MQHRYEIVSIAGLVQYLAANLLPAGYWFYVTGRIPEGKHLARVDEKLIAKYDAAISRQTRTRRKAAGRASVRYLRHGRMFLLLATHGQHEFFHEEPLVRDVRRQALVVGEYSISYRPGAYRRRRPGDQPQRDNRWHTRVRIAPKRYRRLKQSLLAVATHWPTERLARALYRLPFEPYAPVRQQLLNLLRLVNKKRQAAGLEKLPSSVLRYRRRIVTPLRAADEAAEETALKLKPCEEQP